MKAIHFQPRLGSTGSRALMSSLGPLLCNSISLSIGYGPSVWRSAAKSSLHVYSKRMQIHIQHIHWCICIKQICVCIHTHIFLEIIWRSLLKVGAANVSFSAVAGHLFSLKHPHGELVFFSSAASKEWFECGGDPSSTGPGQSPGASSHQFACTLQYISAASSFKGPKS